MHNPVEENKAVHRTALDLSQEKAKKEIEKGVRTGKIFKYGENGEIITEGDIVREQAFKMKAHGSICCAICGLPSGLKNVTLKKSKDGKNYFCAKDCPKISA